MWRLRRGWDYITREAQGQRTAAAEEEDLGRKTEHRLALILNQMNDGFLALDEEWHFTHVNPAAGQLLQKAPGELLGRRIWDVFSDTIYTPLQENLHRVMEERVPAEFEHYCPELTTWYDIRCLRVPEGLVLFFREVAKGGQTAKALRESGELRRLALETAGLGFWDYYPRSHRVVGDERAGALFGLPPNQLTVQNLLQAVHVEDREQVQRALQQALGPESTGLPAMEFRVTLADSTIRWLALKGQVYFEGEGPARSAVRLVGTVRDITDRKRAELALRQARDELAFLTQDLEHQVRDRTAKLQETLAEMQHMSYSMIHDMRAPLRAMNSYARLLLPLNEGAARPEVSEYLQRIATAAERMDHLLTDALNYNKAVREQLPLEALDPGRLLQGMLATYPSFQAPRAEISLEGAFPQVIANESGLTQCVSHLLENALKFVEPGKVPRVRIWAEARENQISLFFEDNGVGIPADFQAKIFEMYQQAHVGYGGTGIGLAIVRKLMERMGGKVGVQSEPGNGSRFWLELRAAQPATGQSKTPVLYVEDDENDVFFLRHALERQGLSDRLKVVNNGAQAIEYLSGEGKFSDREEFPLPALIVLDLELPQVSGLKVLEWKQQQPLLQAIPVVVLSGSGRASDQEKANQLGAVMFFKKSSDVTQFRRLAQYIQQHRLAPV